MIAATAMFNVCEILQQLRERELEREKAVLIQQVNELQEEVVRLSHAKESMHDVSICGTYK